jgi:hypothetical protein
MDSPADNTKVELRYYEGDCEMQIPWSIVADHTLEIGNFAAIPYFGHVRT